MAFAGIRGPAWVPRTQALGTRTRISGPFCPHMAMKKFQTSHTHAHQCLRNAAQHHFFTDECGTVQEEMLGRMRGDKEWHDPHNAGTYTVLESDQYHILAQRVTGLAPHYTDKFLLSFEDDAESTHERCGLKCPGCSSGRQYECCIVCCTRYVEYGSYTSTVYSIATSCMQPCMVHAMAERVYARRNVSNTSLGSLKLLHPADVRARTRNIYPAAGLRSVANPDRKSTRLNSSH